MISESERKNHMKKKLLSFMLVLCLTVSLLPTAALASNDDAAPIGDPAPADIAVLDIAVEEDGTITGDTATDGDLSYYIVDDDKQATIDTWNVETEAAEVTTALGAAESGKPILTADNNDQFLVVVEIKDDKVVAAGQSAKIAIASAVPAPADIADLTITVDENGNITGDTATDGDLSYYIVDTDKQDTIDTWNVETEAAAVNTALGTGESSQPALTADDHNGKFLVVVEIKDGKVVAAGQSAAIDITSVVPAPAGITPLTIAVDAQGAITGDTATDGGDLSYYIVDDDKQDTIDAWTPETEADAVNTALGTGESSQPALTADDHNGKFLVVVEIKDGKVVAAGQSAKIAIAPAAAKVDLLTVTVDENGAITVTGDTTGKTLSYYFVDADMAADIANLDKEVDRTAAEKDLAITAVSGTPGVTAASNGKYLVVLASNSSGSPWRPTYKVVSAGQSGEINITAVLTTDLTVNASGSIKIAKTVSGGDYYYAVVETNPTAELAALTTASEIDDVATALGGAALDSQRPILSDTQNGQFLAVVHLTADGKLDQYGVLEIKDVVPGIKDVYKGKFYIGGTISPGNITSSDYTKWEFIQKHYNALTPENDTKPDNIWNNPKNAFKNPDNVDKMLDSLGDDFFKIGHALAWHNQSTNWPFTAGQTVPTHDEAKALLEKYISTVAGHFQERADDGKATFNAWDVVNEAMRDNPENPTNWRNALRHGDLPIERPARWYEAYANGGNGWDYIYDAFVFARKYAPDATLFYNDFNDEELPNKAIAIASMVKELNAKYAEEYPQDDRPLIGGIGIQSHYSTRLKLENLEEVLKIYASTGCEVHITELDVQINGTNLPAIPTQEQQEVQADFYARLFKLYKKYDHIIERVTWWGTNDSGNWRSSQRPMVFDNNWNPKEAFWAVIDPEEYLGYRQEAPVMESFTYGGKTWTLVDTKGAGVTYEFDVHVPDSVSAVSADDIEAGLGLSSGTSATVTLSNGGAVANGAPCTATVRVSWDDEQDNYTDYTIHFGHMSAEWHQDLNYPDTGYRSTVDIRFSDGVSQLTLEQVFTDENGAVVKTATETFQAPAEHESGTYWVSTGAPLTEDEMNTLTLKKTLTDASGKSIVPARHTVLSEPEAYYQLATEVKVGQTYIIVASENGAAFTHRAAASGTHNGKYQGTSGIVVEDDIITAPAMIQDNIRFVFNPLKSPDTDVTSDGFALQSLVHGGLIQPFILWRDENYDADGFAKLYSDKTISDKDLDRAVWYAAEMDPDTHETVLFLRTASENKTFVLESTDGGISFGAYGGEGSVEEIIAAHPNAKVKLYEYVVSTAYDITCSSTGRGTVSSSVSSANSGETVTVYAKPSSGYEVDSVLVRDANGNRIAVTKVSSGVYSFTMPDSSVTVSVSFDAVHDSGSSSSGGGSSTKDPAYKVNVGSSAHGSVESNRQQSSAGNTVTLTVTPDNGYRLDTLVVTDKHGNEMKLTNKGNNKYTFVMPESKVTVKTTFVKDGSTSGLPFLDVADNAWYYDAVAYVYENGLMNGTTATTFAPNVTTSRAMIATLLYRLEGSPRVSGASFSDVKSGMYYTDAVIWANANGIVTGYSDGTFAPDKAITRQQMATMLYRYAAYKGYDVSSKKDLGSYSDSAQVGAYAVEPLQWATAEGLITGMSDGRLAPAGNAVRAQVATILMRFCKTIAR